MTVSRSAALQVRLAPSAAGAAKIVRDQVNGRLIGRNNRRGPSGLTHTQLHKEPGFNLTGPNSFQKL